MRRFAAGVLVIVGLSACAGDKTPDFNQPVENLYNRAMGLMLDGKYAAATKAFDDVERQHPYSVWATKAQIMAAYSNYQGNQYDEAILAARRFIDLHPGHRDVDYAYYLIAISYYEQISDVGRDQKMTKLAFEALEEVIRRFPDSTYARDAILKLNLTRDHLAGKEMEIGRYYQRQGAPLAAINRFRIVVKKYQITSHVPEALLRLTESYLALGVIDEAQATAAVLGYNYPGSKWYQDSYELLTGGGSSLKKDKKSWLKRAWSSIFKSKNAGNVPDFPPKEGVDPSIKEGVDPSTKEDADPSTKEDADPSTKEDADPSTREDADPSTREDADPSTKEGVDPLTREDADQLPKEDADTSPKEDNESWIKRTWRSIFGTGKPQ